LENSLNTRSQFEEWTSASRTNITRLARDGDRLPFDRSNIQVLYL
jgi:hypothetical protein